MVSTTDEVTPVLAEKAVKSEETIEDIKEVITNGNISSNGNDTEPSVAENGVHVSKENGNSDDSEIQEPPVSERPVREPSSSPTESSQNGSSVECINIDDDDETSKEPPAKRTKVEEPDTDSATPKPEEGEKKPELNSPEALLDKLDEYVADAINSKKNVERKVLDALLGAINVQVQREPLSVRKLILDKQLVLPNTISFPPSSVVDMIIEHDPEFPLSKVVTKMFGDDRPKLSDSEKKERQVLKAHNPAPHMTKLLMDIGQDLVQESTYCDIVHAKNLPETPKNLETYKTVAAQLKPVWEALKKKNEPYKLNLHKCQVCGFQTESRLVLQNHRSRSHFRNGKYQCAMCPEYDTNEQRLLNHYLESHLVIAQKDDLQAKYPCLICEEDFQFKGLRDQHMKMCKKDYARVRHVMAPKLNDDILMVNRWLWDRPPIDPTILQQQQAAQAQQKKTQLQQAQAQAQAAALRRGVNNAASALLQQQMLQNQQRQQQQMRQQIGALMNNRSLIGSNNLIAAMQQHLQRAAAAGSRGGATLAAAATPFLNNKNLSVASKNALIAAQQLAAQQQALKRNATVLTPQVQKALSNAASMMATTNGTNGSSQSTGNSCEICDQSVTDKERYLAHLQNNHKQMRGKSVTDMQQGAPLACSRCRDRFWTYEGLERHLVMSHGLVTADLLQKAQKKEDGGRCKLCGKQYAFNMLQHLVADHQVKLCSAEIMYSCDVCSFKCSSYHQLETHLSTVHPKAGEKDKPDNGKKPDDCITLDD